DRYKVAVGNVCSGRTLFKTKNGLLGLGPKLAKRDDAVCVFLGGSVPYVVRNLSLKGSDHHFVGECYLHGFMFGKAITMW
ncbi:hypothetical protein BKA56DRAFT_431294, partial [Ilyonectria sp. MPI-CAGE-AT-0026]